MIRLVDVSREYPVPRSSDQKQDGPVHALREVSMEIADGEFVTVMGPSGCGKSTLLHLIGGLDRPSRGEIWVHQEPFHRMDERALSLFRRGNVGIVFQFFNLLPQLTSLENTVLPLRLDGVSPAESESRALGILGEVGLGGKTDRLPAELSGGEQQRVAIARAMVHRPKLVLADEPTGNLDSASSTAVLGVLKDLQRTHRATLLLVTHSHEVSLSAHRTISMQDGRIRTDSHASSNPKKP